MCDRFVKRNRNGKRNEEHTRSCPRLFTFSYHFLIWAIELMAEPKVLLNAIGHFLIDILKETGELQKLFAAIVALENYLVETSTISSISQAIVDAALGLVGPEFSSCSCETEIDDQQASQLDETQYRRMLRYDDDNMEQSWLICNGYRKTMAIKFTRLPNILVVSNVVGVRLDYTLPDPLLRVDNHEYHLDTLTYKSSIATRRERGYEKDE
ncbi:MAG: hypothetical protein J3R72DRAFT_481125 [Linnemannia gamsii]|nr:MAG: hypothetical protein J3R72DRAFT_481125 [Linnemannia gamsii]